MKLERGLVRLVLTGPRHSGALDKATNATPKLSIVAPGFPHGTMELPDGTMELPDGTMELPDGTMELPDGTMELPDGTMELPHGPEELPDGTMELPHGTEELPHGTMELPHGTEELLHGTWSSSSGPWSSPTGRRSSPTGPWSSPTGRRSSSSGAWSSFSGRWSFSTGPWNLPSGPWNSPSGPWKVARYGFAAEGTGDNNQSSGMLPYCRRVQGGVRLRLHERGDVEARCAYCHDALAAPQRACERCRTRLHDDCWAELPRCPTLGCFALRVSPRRATETGCTRLFVAVVAVLGPLMFLALMGPVAGPGHEAKIGASKQQISNLESALDMFQADCGRYPTTAEGLEALRTRPRGLETWKGPYMKKELPLDAWGNPYNYRCPGHQGDTSVDLWSNGPDGVEGTDDDIQNWNVDGMRKK